MIDLTMASALDALRGSWDSLLRWIWTLNREEWFVLLALTTLLGFFCMKGFGSRQNF